MLTDREFHWLKRRVFCTYCAKILVDPHPLTCLHPVCAGCGSKLRTLSGAAGVAYQCTVCDRFYDKIKPNFIIARLVSAYVFLTEQRVVDRCAQCRVNAATHRCVDCRADYCATCREMHDACDFLVGHCTIALALIVQCSSTDVSSCDTSRTRRLSRTCSLISVPSTPMGSGHRFNMMRFAQHQAHTIDTDSSPPTQSVILMSDDFGGKTIAPLAKQEYPNITQR